MNEIRIDAWFQRFAISQRRGFRFRDPLKAMPKELQHPVRADRLIMNAQKGDWLFMESLGRRKIKLDDETQDQRSNPTKRKRRFRLGHPRYYTRGWLPARLQIKAADTMRALSKYLLSDYALAMWAQPAIAAHRELMRPMTGILLDQIRRNLWITYSLKK